MMASYLRPFPSTKQSKLFFSVSHIHSGLIWPPLLALWSVSHSSSTLNLSSRLSPFLALKHHPGPHQDHFAKHFPLHFPLTAFHPIILLYFLPSVLPHSVVPPSQPPQSLSTHHPPRHASFCPCWTIRQTFPPVSSGQQSPKTLSTHREPSPSIRERTNKETGVPAVDNLS